MRWRYDSRRRLQLAWLSVLLATSGLACDGGTPAPGGGRFPTVVLVSVAGMRGDHLGRSGYPRATTPFIDALAQRSLAFERAYAASSRALTSNASLMSGLAPGQHGVWEEGVALAASVPTLAEQMAERGYTTAAFVGTRRRWHATGLPRGFGHFSQPGRVSVVRYRRGGETVDQALAWLAAQPEGQPTFLWLQLEDPTKPLNPLPDPAAAALVGIDPLDLIAYKLEQHRIPFGHFNYENRHVLRLINRYDGELRAVDDALARLYSGMEEGGGAGVLWVVTSPHGMGLGNHFWDGASRQIYETQVRVPLFFHTPGGELRPRQSDAVVSQLDLASVLLALVDGSHEPLEDLFGGAGGGAGGVLVQRGALVALGRSSNRIGRPDADPGQQDAWVEARWKLLRHSDGSELLFDVADDPYETRDRVAEASAEELERLRGALAAQLEARGLTR
jgi:arylsulfatase A-like enzyme